MCCIRFDITEDQSGAVGPASATQGRGVWHQVKIAVATVPVRKLVTLDWLHVHVDRQQIVAGMGAVCQARFQEEASVETFAEEPSIVIGETHDDGVYLVSCNAGL